MQFLVPKGSSLPKAAKSSVSRVIASRPANLIHPVASMFSCCDGQQEGETSQSMDMYESGNNMALLVRLLQDPLLPLPEASTQGRPSEQILGPLFAVIPHVLLPRLFALGEKYALKPPVMQILHTHLLAQASIAPLLVYGLACQYSLAEIADKASKFLVFTPLERYGFDDVKVIPTAEAYHKLLQLQSYRKQRIKGLLMNEELFPHGYGACSAHKDYAEAIWDKRRRSILPDVHSGELPSTWPKAAFRRFPQGRTLLE